MEPEQRELIRHLFAEITALLEEAHDCATEGQAQTRSAPRLRAIADDLTTAAHDVLALAGAIDVVLGPQRQTKAKPSKRR